MRVTALAEDAKDEEGRCRDRMAWSARRLDRLCRAGRAGAAVMLVIGLAAGMLQTMTQIREASIPFVLKLAGLAALTTAAGPLMMGGVEHYATSVQRDPGTAAWLRRSPCPAGRR